MKNINEYLLSRNYIYEHCHAVIKKVCFEFVDISSFLCHVIEPTFLFIVP